MRDEFLVFGAPQIEQAEIDEVVATLKSRWIGTGPRVARFERDFAAYKAIDHDQVAAVGSGTAALHLSLIGANVGPGDEVITTAMTFCASVNAIIHAGATPVLVDIDPESRNMDPAAVVAAITPKTRAILPVHFAGYPCDMTAIMAIAKDNDLKVIEDCAHAIESEVNGHKIGTLGDFGCFSFYATKNLVTGEGGMILASNADSINRIKQLALHGLSHDAWKRFSDAGHKHYFVEECGFKYNMMDLQAALGIHQLARIESNWEKRRTIWRTYQRVFKELPIALPVDPGENFRHAYHLYIVTLNDSAPVSRDEFLSSMIERKVGIGVHYLAIPEHPYYQRAYGWKPQDYPHATRFGRSCVSLPLSATLTDEDVQDVIDSVSSLLCK